MAKYAQRFQQLIDSFSKMPGIGLKSAERLAFYLLRAPKEEVEKFLTLIGEVRRLLRPCRRCFNLSEEELCTLCKDPARSDALLCVVEEPKDVLTLEKTKSFRGRYHVLMGAISPLEGIGPEQLKIKELIGRLQNGSAVKEVILAMDSDAEGETTALYLARALKGKPFKVTRLGFGLPIGGHIEHTDEATLTKALESRREI